MSIQINIYLLLLLEQFILTANSTPIQQYSKKMPQKQTKLKKNVKNSKHKTIVNLVEQEKQELYQVQQIQYNVVQNEKQFDQSGIEEQLQDDQWNYYYVKAHDDFSVKLIQDLKKIKLKKEGEEEILKSQLQTQNQVKHKYHQVFFKKEFKYFCKSFCVGLFIVWAVLVLYELSLSNMYNQQLLKQNLQKCHTQPTKKQLLQKDQKKLKLKNKKGSQDLKQNSQQQIVVHKVQERQYKKKKAKQKQQTIQSSDLIVVFNEQLNKVLMKEYQWSKQEMYNDEDELIITELDGEASLSQDYYELKANQFKLGSRQLNEKVKMQNALKFWMMTSKNTAKNDELKKFQQIEKNYYQQKYQISQYGQIQICVVVLSYMNEADKRYKRNLDSIFHQDYDNYKVYYVDDNSEDRTAELVKNYIRKNKLYEKIKFYQNKQKKGKSYNQFYVGQQNCKPGSIMIVVDGDDQLIGKQVFKLLNAAYQSTNAYYIYTNFIIINQRSHQARLGFSRKLSQGVILNRTFRHNSMPSHLRTWMTDLFLDIQKQDLFYKGDFPSIGQDVGSSFLLMEKAGKKIEFLSQFVYRYVIGTGLNDDFLDRDRQMEVENYYRSLQKYPVYNKPINFSIKPKNKKNPQQYF